MPARTERTLRQIIARGGLRVAQQFAAALYKRGGALASRLGTIFPEAGKRTLKALARVTRQAYRAAREITQGQQRWPRGERGAPHLPEAPSTKLGRGAWEVTINARFTNTRGRTTAYRTYYLQFDSKPTRQDIESKAGQVVASRNWLAEGEARCPQAKRISRAWTMDIQVLAVIQR